ncbi:MAG: hypothetical protein V1859_02735 [archaeon]
MLRIILDTNFLFIPFSMKVDIFKEIERIILEPYELCILEGSIRELNNIIAKTSGKERDNARLALLLIKKKGIKIISPPDKQKSLYTADNSQELIHLDTAIVEAADAETIVATQDRGLKRLLKEKGISVIVLREKQYLELI